MKRTRKIMATLLALTLLLTLCPAALASTQITINGDTFEADGTTHTIAAEFRSSGNNITYLLDDEGMLFISGTGDMEDFANTGSDPEGRPWNSYRSAITSVVAEAGISHIGRWAFAWCYNLKDVNIGDGVTDIGGGAFYYCSNLTSVRIPGSVTSIGAYAFSFCSSLISVNYGGTKEEWNTLISKSGSSNSPLTLATVNCTDGTISNADYSGTCGDSATWSLDSNGVLTISGTGSMKDYSYPPSSSSDLLIGNEAPWRNLNVTSVVVEEGITTVGSYAFYRCSALMSVTIPDSVTNVRSYAFGSCEALTAVYYGGTAEQWSAITIDSNGNDPLTTARVYYESSGPSDSISITSLYPTVITKGGETTFTVTVSYSLQSVDEGIIYLGVNTETENKYKLYANEPVLKGAGTVTLSATVTTATDWETVVYVSLSEADHAEDWTPLASSTYVCYSYGLPASGTCGENLAWALDSDGILVISGTGEMDSSPWRSYSSYITSAEIGSDVTSICADAFGWCYNLTSVSIPSSVTTIGDGAFAQTGLTEIVIPEGVTHIGENAFCDNDDLIRVIIPASVTEIEEGAFANDQSLKYFTVSEDSTSYCSVNNVLFSKDMTLLVSYPAAKNGTGYSIPSTVTELLGGAFAGCKKLESVSVPSVMTQWGDGAFWRCEALTSVTISKGVTSIGYRAFLGCESLATVTIPSSVTSIGYVAFLGCDKLENIHYEGNTDAWSAIDIDATTEYVYDEATGTWVEKSGNYPLEGATMHYNSYPEFVYPLEAYRYVPFTFSVNTSIDEAAFTLASGSLPTGITLSQNGVISGMATALGTFNFTVQASNGADSETLKYTLTVSSNTAPTAEDAVDDVNEEGYGFVITADEETGEITNTGRVQDQTVTSANQLVDQTMHSEGDYEKFVALYIDAVKQARDIDYTVKEGSTVITISDETFARFGNGTHTIAAEFEASSDDGETEYKYTVQNYTVTGIPESNGYDDNDYDDYDDGYYSGDSGNNTSPVVTQPTAPTEITDANGAVELAFTVSGNEAVLDELSTEILNELREAENPVAMLDLSGKDPSITSLMLSDAIMDQLSELLSDGMLVIEFDVASLEFDGISLQAMAGQNNGDLKLDAEDISAEVLNAAQQDALDGMETFGGIRLTLTSGDAAVESFDGGRVGIHVPFTIPDGRNEREFSAFYVSEDGATARHATRYEDAALGFRAAHFSDFVIAKDIAVSFVDISDSAWYVDSVDYIARSAIMTGVGNNSFAPELKLTRAMFAQILYNMEDGPEPVANAGFTDVAEDKWYADAVNWASDVGVVSGMGDGTYAPEVEITREQLALMLYNYAQYKGYNLSHSASLSKYNDADQLSSWAEAAMCWALGEKLFNGMDAHTLAPTEGATRAQSAKVLTYFKESFEI